MLFCTTLYLYPHGSIDPPSDAWPTNGCPSKTRPGVQHTARCMIMSPDITSVLGILIAFVTVILLLSIVVTSLVQAVQAFIRLRARNLWLGLSKILTVEEGLDPTVASDKAIKILNRVSSAMRGKKEDGNKFFSNLFGPKVSWLEPEELKKTLQKYQTNLGVVNIDNIIERYEDASKSMSKRFQHYTRLLTIVCATLVAVHFQVSTPELLEELSADPQRVQKLVELADKILDEEDKKELLDEAREQAKQELALISVLSRQRDYFYVDYGEGDKPEKSDKATIERCRGNKSGCTRFFKWDNIVGTAITVLLLTLGAPFWFNMLKNLVNLRDTLKQGSGKPKPDDEQDKVAKEEALKSNVASAVAAALTAVEAEKKKQDENDSKAKQNHPAPPSAGVAVAAAGDTTQASSEPAAPADGEDIESG